MELLISLCLSSLILTIAIRQYCQVKTVYFQQLNLLDEATDTVFLNSLIKSRIKMAGFTPCGEISNLRVQDVDRPFLRGLVIDKPDKFSVNRMSEYFVQGIVNSSENEVIVTESEAIHAGDLVLIADCYQAELGRVRSVYHDSFKRSLVLDKVLVYAYESPFYVGSWISEQFYIHRNKEGEPSLLYRSTHADELSARIRDMKITIEHYKRRDLVNLEFTFKSSQTLQLMLATYSK